MPPHSERCTGTGSSPRVLSRRTRTPRHAAPDLSKGSHIASFTMNTEKAMIQDGWWTASGTPEGLHLPAGAAVRKCFRRVCSLPEYASSVKDDSG